MNELQIFRNEKFGEVRTIEENGKMWFVGKDVADILGYTNSPKAIRDHVDDEDKLTERIVLSGQNREVIFINESGLYALIFGSKLKTAKEFKHWVTSEILPSIRKHGAYVAPQNGNQTAHMKEALAEAKLNNSRARVSSMWLKISEKIPVQEYKQICASYASAALAGKEVIPLPEVTGILYTAEEVGKILGISGQKVGRIANQNHLKTEEYGKRVWDKAKYSAKQVESFRYNDKAVSEIKKYLD